MRKSPHQQQGFCVKCLNGAEKYNHCTWCGKSFPDSDVLSEHLDEGCLGKSLQHSKNLDLFDNLSAANVDFPFTAKTGAQKMRAVRREQNKTRRIIVWDGEGAHAPGRRIPQDYVLFGCYDGKDHDFITDKQLTTMQCLRQIIKIGKRYPGAWHFSFYFSYDVNMILRNLPLKSWEILKKDNWVYYGHYRINHVPGKWFMITDKSSPRKKVTVKIFDTSGFYQTSFVKSLKANLADHPLMANLSQIESGKDKRAVFTYDQLDFITDYWKVEQVLFHALSIRLREYMYEAGLMISNWHGPGAIASYLYNTHRIKEHKSDTPDHIYSLARFAYCGGRFERFHIGRFTNVYGYDIRSAYPYAISKLPSLAGGKWHHRDNVGTIAEFGIYRIELRKDERVKPGPFFKRDQRGNITFPWKVDGWYWSPEISAAIKHDESIRDSIREGWEFTPADNGRPFAFVIDLFNRRAEWKRVDNGAQMALKLALNSLYGKMAQRAGWRIKNGPPTWHQLEWAGWVTSYTRARLYDVMASIEFDRLIAVETDGFFTTEKPDSLRLPIGTDLGEWEVTFYDEVIYLQSGVYANRQGEKWSMKYRGLDADSVTVDALINHSKKLIGLKQEFMNEPMHEYWTDDGVLWRIDRRIDYTKPQDMWPKLEGTTTRFIGYEHALMRAKQNRGPFHIHHRVWETAPVEIDCWGGNKRTHDWRNCQACQTGRSAYEQAHSTVIKERLDLKRLERAARNSKVEMEDHQSYPHDIPWLDDDTDDFWWRAEEDMRQGLIREMKY